MANRMSSALLLVAVITIICNIGHVQSNPAIASGFDPLGTCIENCAQCKKMLGAWFDGPLCAESCIKFKGKLIPECENIASISPFLTKLQ